MINKKITSLAGLIRQNVCPLVMVSVLTACGGSSGGDSSSDTTADTNTSTPIASNTAPVANAGNDQSVITGDTITLDASGSSDADGDSLSYSWSISSLPAGSNISLSNANSQSASFIVDVDGDYVIALVVNDGTEDSNTDTVTISSTTQSSGNTDPVSSNGAWVVNDNGEAAVVLNTNGADILVNVTDVTTTTVNDKEYTYIQTSGIPAYKVTMTQEIIDSLNSRPDANRAFITGATSASVGDVIEFGQDIGYDGNEAGCTTGAGYGYWPPGPVCPEDINAQVYLPKEPEPAVENCETGMATQGLWVNGAAVFTWSDGQSYNNQGVWQSLAPIQEVYDVDICGGHAANGTYHQHQYSSCLADLVGDTGNDHSPVYGYAADGYPIYGPWQADGVLAKSSWVARDYENVDSITGCGVAGERSCQLIDSLDPGAGTTTVASGPSTSDQVSNLTGLVQFTAVSGFYFEDYYWDSSLSGEEVLDQHNGHSDEARGYHYHVTLTEDSEGKQTPSFPFIFGPEYYGELADNSVAACGLTGGPGGPPPR
ncbi:YHYH protein [Thalassomonas viridans]|uniref:YHYH protein n=1 Tax=Thalassomonas viridans TaxID=137584 RepID=A0AAE9Z184_9GAMM|nr:YHYH protein [Thalassomonas viridans]WDE03362.1 YHYH protein [Thalassomonas viridans]